MKQKKEKLCECIGCQWEFIECYKWQDAGYDAGLEFDGKHCFFFVLDKYGKFIVPFYEYSEIN